MSDEELTYNAGDYGFNFDINNIDATVVGNYGLDGGADFLYGLSTVVDTGITGAAVLAGGAGLAKAGAQVTAKAGLKAAIRAFLKNAGDNPMLKNGALATLFGPARAGFKATEEGVGLAGDIGSRTAAAIAAKQATKKGAGNLSSVAKQKSGNLYAIGDKTFDLAKRTDRKALKQELGLARQGLVQAIMADAGTMALIGAGVALSVQGKVATASNVLNQQFIPSEVSMMADIMLADKYVEVGDVESLLEIQTRLYNYDNVQSNNLVDIAMQGMGEDASDNMFWIQTRLAMAAENANNLGAEAYVPKSPAEVILSVDELNNLYADYKDDAGGVESQQWFGATLTDKIKKAQENKHKFFFGNAAYYLADENGDTFRVTSAEYYTAFNEYAKSKGETLDWTSDVNEGTISLLQSEFEKDATNWKTETVAANGALDEATLTVRKKADQLNKYGIYDMNDVVAGNDGVIRAKNAFGTYKVGDPIIFDEADAETLGQYIIEYQEMPEARGAWDAALAIDSEAAKKFQEETQAVVDNNLITAKEGIKQWYADNGLRYDANDTFIQESAQKLADSGLNADVFKQWKTDLAQQKIGVWESKYKGWADKLATGQYSVKDLSEGYLTQIANIYGVNYDDIDVDDPLMKMIFKEDGTVMSVQEAERAIKSRPSYEYTQNAAKDYGDIAVSLASRWGV
jgi:hypothetical protein